MSTKKDDLTDTCICPVLRQEEVSVHLRQEELRKDKREHDPVDREKDSQTRPATQDG